MKNPLFLIFTFYCLEKFQFYWEIGSIWKKEYFVNFKLGKKEEEEEEKKKKHRKIYCVWGTVLLFIINYRFSKQLLGANII